MGYVKDSKQKRIRPFLPDMLKDKKDAVFVKYS
jgi:hypothetical protein